MHTPQSCLFEMALVWYARTKTNTLLWREREYVPLSPWIPYSAGLSRRGVLPIALLFGHFACSDEHNISPVAPVCTAECDRSE
jgi:hypothetical protein